MVAAVLGGPSASRSSVSDVGPSTDTTGLLQTYSINGPIDLSGPFFQPLGAGGRSCASCHRPAQGWTISTDEIRTRFQLTKGLDPIFRESDGANCNSNVHGSTLEDRRAAYSLLVNRGLIRVALPIPANAEFEVAGVANKYGCTDKESLSVYRRPLPATNLRFLSTVMWDGRGSSPQTGTRPIGSDGNPADLMADLARQALDAADVHLQASHAMTPQRQQLIVKLEMGLATAQAFDAKAGALDAGGAKGGPMTLAVTTMPAFFIGINDTRGGDPHRIKAEDAVRLFDAWSLLPYGRLYTEIPATPDPQIQRRASIARGQLLFDQKPFDIRGVAGLNDELRLTSITGACGTCHNSPNVGNHSVSLLLNIGTTDASGPLDFSYLPAMTLRNSRTRESIVTTDPGYALVTGQWKDVGKVKVPVLRGLAARPPYFHNGSAQSLGDVIEFYDQRFHIGLNPREKEDLIAFLSAL